MSDPKPQEKTNLMPWFKEAIHQLGLKETPGPKSNADILNWAKRLHVSSVYTNDSIPWCGLFVAHCINTAYPTEKLPSNILGAKQWATFGIATTPRLGAIMVFWRESKTSGKGHVGFYVGEDATSYCILGGNQSDSVSYTWVAKDRLVGARWPIPAKDVKMSAVMLTRNSKLSSNEA